MFATLRSSNIKLCEIQSNSMQHRKRWTIIRKEKNPNTFFSGGGLFGIINVVLLNFDCCFSLYLSLYSKLTNSNTKYNHKCMRSISQCFRICSCVNVFVRIFRFYMPLMMMMMLILQIDQIIKILRRYDKFFPFSSVSLCWRINDSVIFILLFPLFIRKYFSEVKLSLCKSKIVCICSAKLICSMEIDEIRIFFYLMKKKIMSLIEIYKNCKMTNFKLKKSNSAKLFDID